MRSLELPRNSFLLFPDELDDLDTYDAVPRTNERQHLTCEALKKCEIMRLHVILEK